MSSSQNFQKELLEISATTVSKKSYWLISTNDGRYFDCFYTNNFIAAKFGKITVADVMNLKSKNRGRAKFLRELRCLCKRVYVKEKKADLMAERLFHFIYEIKKNDTVSIQSDSQIAFGRILNTRLIDVANNSRRKCPCTFRKEVKWLRIKSRDNFSSCLY